MLCCQARAPSVGQITLLTGASAQHVAHELVSQQPQAKAMGLQPHYLPGVHVPIVSLGLGRQEVAQRVAHAAGVLAGSGFHVVLQAADPTQELTHVAARELDGAGHRVVAALAYVPLRALAQRAPTEDVLPAALHFGLAFRGTERRTPRTLGYLHRKDVQAVAKAVAARHGAQAADALEGMLSPLLLPGAGAKGAFFEPRFDHDVVVDATTPASAAKALLKTRHAPGFRSAVYALTHSPAAVPRCAACPEARAHCVGCLNAARHALQRADRLRVPRGALGGSLFSLPLTEHVYRVPEPQLHFRRDPAQIYYWQRDGDQAYPFLNLYDGNFKRVPGIIAINGPFWDDQQYNKFLEYKTQGNKFVGISSFEQYPGRIEDPNDTEYARTRDVFKDPAFRESLLGWLHCFHEPSAVIPADVPYMLLPESDLLDPHTYVPDPKEEKLYDFYYYTHDGGWEDYVRNWEVGRECVRLMAEKYNLKVVLAGKGDNPSRPTHPNVTSLSLLGWSDFVNKVIRKSKYCFIASIFDPSPRTPVEGMLLGCPVLENAQIIGGWHYISPQTGMTWDGTVEGFERSLVTFLEKAQAGEFRPREWWTKRFGRRRAGARLYDWLHMLPGSPVADQA